MSSLGEERAKIRQKKGSSGPNANEKKGYRQTERGSASFPALIARGEAPGAGQGGSAKRLKSILSAQGNGKERTRPRHGELNAFSD